MGGDVRQYTYNGEDGAWAKRGDQNQSSTPRL